MYASLTLKETRSIHDSMNLPKPNSFLKSRLPNARMLNIWLNIKTNPPGIESKIGECHATDYAFLRLWYKFEVKKFSCFVRFTCVPEFDRNVFIARNVNMT